MTDKPITQAEIDRLRAPFPLEAHSIREGNKVRGGQGIQWFVYVEKTEVETRLNEIFPGEWGSTQPVLYPLGNSVAATIGITIRGITRGNTGEDSNGQEKGKGATTDAFRRAAADWGVAKYVWEMEFIIYTDAYPDKDWKAQEAKKKEAFGKFADWYKKKFQNVTPIASNSHQEGATRDLAHAAGDYEARTPQQALKGNGAPPAGQKKESDGAFSYSRVELFAQAAMVQPLKGISTQERNNTIIKMEGEGAFTDAQDYQQCVELVIKRVNSPEHGSGKKAVSA